MKRVAVYLAPTEKFSPSFGGALAKWTHKVYPLIATQVATEIYCQRCTDEYRTPTTSKVTASKWATFGHSLIGNRDLKGLLRPIKRFISTRYQANAAKAIARGNWDIVHIHNDLHAVKPIKRRNPNSTILLHMNNDHLVDNFSLDEGTSQEAVALSDAIIFCSEYLRTNAFSRIPILKHKPTKVVYNGADLISEDQLESPKAKKAKLVTAKQVLFVGRIVPEKGPHLLIDAIKTLLADGVDLTLKIVGGVNFGDIRHDAYLRSLKDQAREHQDKIIFTGPVPHSDTVDYYLESDLFVCPSLWQEPLGMVNLEAMSYGLPVIAFANGGIPEAVGDAGLLLPTCGPKVLAEAIRTTLASPIQCNNFSMKGRERIKNSFAWEKIAQDWLELLTSITADRITPLN